MFCSYITTLPNIPHELLYDTTTIDTLPNVFWDKRTNVYTSYNVSAQLKQWVTNTFAPYYEYVNCMYVRINPGHSAHVDVNRSYCYNYVLQTADASTVWFDNDEIIYSEKIPARQWVCLDTKTKHQVVFENTEVSRYLLTVTPLQTLPRINIP
jgi:hypothetical protein